MITIKLKKNVEQIEADFFDGWFSLSIDGRFFVGDDFFDDLSLSNYSYWLDRLKVLDFSIENGKEFYCWVYDCPHSFLGVSFIDEMKLKVELGVLNNDETGECIFSERPKGFVPEQEATVSVFDFKIALKKLKI